MRAREDKAWWRDGSTTDSISGDIPSERDRLNVPGGKLWEFRKTRQVIRRARL